MTAPDELPDDIAELKAIIRAQQDQNARLELLVAAFSPSRITLENNGKIRPRPDREKRFSWASGGDEGIRTLETLPGLLP